MIKRLFFVITALLAMSLPVESAPVSLSRAKAVAEGFAFRSAQGFRVPAGAAASLTLACQKMSGATGEPSYYVFNRGTDQGFVVVSGDDEVIPVMGYSDSGSFDPQDMPESMVWWLEEYEHQLNFLRAHAYTQARQPVLLTTSVEPLLKTKWNQDFPYNKKCPTYDNGSKTCVTGCVATAVAQIMKYHTWPYQGSGSHSYNCHVNGASTPTLLTANFGESSYSWYNMLNGYSLGGPTTKQNAVARLMSDVGIALDMQYGASSGAYSEDVPVALKVYFGYSPSLRLLYRSNYDDDVWEAMLRDELDAGRPIYYSGASDRGGHAFVFDGYNTDGYFHINWGWGGKSDGYFLSSVLDPSQQGAGASSGGYSMYQDAIIGIQPRQEGEPEAVYALSMDDFDINPGDTVQVPVMLQMPEFARALQYQLELPEGITLCGVSLTDELSEGYETSYSPIVISITGATIDRTHRVVINNLYDEKKTYWGYDMGLMQSDDGMVCQYLTLVADEALETGRRLSMNVTNAKALLFDDQERELSDVITQITIPGEGMYGDINLDGHVDVVDVSILIDIVLGKEPIEKYGQRAYITGHTYVDVQDVSALIDIVLGK